MRPNEQSARPAAAGPDLARSEAESLLGDFRTLLGQLGSPEFTPISPNSSWSASAPSQFLENYVSRLLTPCELPAIVAACGHARRGELRELLAQDHLLAERLVLTPFAEPSRRIGWQQLARLRPLRDERTVQRYLAAVESGHAHGWHTVVYGVILAVFSLPLRQGLLYYAQETLTALASAASRSRIGGASDPSEVLSDLLARMPEAVEAALTADTAVATFSGMQKSSSL